MNGKQLCSIHHHHHLPRPPAPAFQLQRLGQGIGRHAHGQRAEHAAVQLRGLLLKEASHLVLRNRETGHGAVAVPLPLKEGHGLKSYGKTMGKL